MPNAHTRDTGCPRLGTLGTARMLANGNAGGCHVPHIRAGDDVRARGGWSVRTRYDLRAGRARDERDCGRRGRRHCGGRGCSGRDSRRRRDPGHQGLEAARPIRLLPSQLGLVAIGALALVAVGQLAEDLADSPPLQMLSSPTTSHGGRSSPSCCTSWSSRSDSTGRCADHSRDCARGAHRCRLVSGVRRPHDATRERRADLALLGFSTIIVLAGVRGDRWGATAPRSGGPRAALPSGGAREASWCLPRTPCSAGRASGSST